MNQTTRRDFQRNAIGSLLTWSLLETLFARDAFAKDVRPLTANWLAELNQWGLDLKGKKLEARQWQEKVQQLYSTVDLPDLLRFIDFEKLTKNIKPKEKGELSLKATLPQVEGLPTELVFGHQVFALAKGRSVVPHGHDNMATAFLILQGDFHGRHYDRLEDEAEHMIITPTIDREFGPGVASEGAVSLAVRSSLDRHGVGRGVNQPKPAVIMTDARRQAARLFAFRLHLAA